MMNPRIFIGIASSGSCQTTFAVCLAQLVAYFQTELLSPEVNSQELTVDAVLSSGIAHNYNQLVLRAREWKATHLLTLEDDMGFHPRVPHLLYRKHQLWVGANYPMRCDDTPSFTALANSKDKRVITENRSDGLEACCYTGFGCTLFDMHIFDVIEQPWFLMAWLGDNNYATQDAWFGEKCNAAGITPYVDHDASKLVWHIGIKHYTHQETIAKLRLAAEVRKDQTNGQ